MSLLNFLRLQEIDSSFDDVSDESRLRDDDIELTDQFDEDSLENYWNQVVQELTQLASIVQGDGNTATPSSQSHV